MKSSAYGAIRLERDAHVVTLTLNRPEVLNAYDRRMRDEMFGALEWIAEDSSVRALVLRGAGKAFCSGGDISEFGTAPSPLRAREVRQVRDVWRRLATLPCVSIAGVHGVAAGGGLEMALLCDLMICARDARLGLPETGLGLIPGVGGTQTLPRAVGEARAAGLLLLGEWIDGAQAASIGLAVEAVPRARLDAAVSRWAGAAADLEGGLMRALKQCLTRGRDLPLREGLALERRLHATLREAGA